MVLALRGIAKSFAGPAGPVAVLAGIDLDLAAGAITAIRGASGSGKTTLLLIAGGLLRPDAGSVRLQGEDLHALAAAPRARRRAAGIGFVFQQFHLLPYLTVLDNILVPALAANDAGLRERARELAERFGLGARLAHRPAALSTGERQRVALARALLRRPALLLADEPTGNLDPDSAANVMHHLREYATAGGAVLLATHDPRATRHAATRLRLAAGRLAPETAEEAVP
jgi:ABC-type lipoprotein export system ATPase subunit